MWGKLKMNDHRDKSYWLENYGPYSPSPPLEGDLDVDVAIIGAGYTGLSTALNLRKDQPGLKVVVLEAEVVGYGASGRNGGFSMTLFGLEPAVTKAIFGHQRTIEAHRYMERAVDYVDGLINGYDLQSGYWFPGFLRAATTPVYVKRIQNDFNILSSLGITGIEWLEAGEIRAEVNSPRFLGGWWEPRCGLLDPAQEEGALILEYTPVSEIIREENFTLITPRGKVAAEKIAFATNVYSHLVPELKSKKVPAFTHMVITEPLKEEHFADIGWVNRQGIEDARNLVHYFRLTVDKRLAMGGSDISISYGRDMDCDRNERIFMDLERDITWLFPILMGIKLTHRWGGPVSVPVDLAPAIGYIGDQRAVYSLGCLGHGVSMAHLNGRTLKGLILEIDTELTDVWFVNRRLIPWPPEPLRLILSHAIRGYLWIEDAIYERGLSLN
jgi:glycine/D-amino acid oxidase-like deaminating enzyme